MKHSLASLLLVSTALLPGLLATPARAATMILHDFIAGDGAHPYGSLALSGSKLYGMTNDGALASDGRGTLFGMNTDGTGFTALHRFTDAASDGRNPEDSLTISGSKLYGMTYQGGSGGYGTVFNMNTDGSGFGLLHSFSFSSSDGTYPHGSLTLSGSKLYGMTGSGGATNSGTVFSMNTDGTGFSLLHSFRQGTSDGYFPHGSLTLIGSKLYGMTLFGGGTSDAGVLFSMNTDGTGYTLLHTFIGGTSDGSRPWGSLTLSNSMLYGLSGSGGSGAGTLFRIGTDGTGFSLLHSFVGGTTDGSGPLGSLAVFNSTLYGMTEGGGANGSGTLFSIGTDGTGYGVLENFRGRPTDGANPLVGTPNISDDGSLLYGMTRFGGSRNSGAVFAKALVPEPGTFALLGLGPLVLFARRRNART